MIRPELRYCAAAALAAAAIVNPINGVPVSAEGGPDSWANVTPSNVDLSSPLDCGNNGTSSVVADPSRPTDLYAQFDCQGIWKSKDYGLSWRGPINTGPGGAAVGNGAGGLAIGPGPTSDSPPILYSASIRGQGIGFWRSDDGGVSWTHFAIPPAGDRQDIYPPAVDPYDALHVIVAGHELNRVYESTDGGASWDQVNMDPGMNEGGGTGALFFINTGDRSTTRGTWLWSAQAETTGIGTWRTANGGVTWVRTEGNEHMHGAMQIYQPDTSGAVFMAGVYSAQGWGVLRSTDFGQTWRHVGLTGTETTVFGTGSRVYAMYGIGGQGPSLEVAAQPGDGDWVAVTTPKGMSSGAAQTTVVFDGSEYVIVGANWSAGLWRHTEAGPPPASSSTATAPMQTEQSHMTTPSSDQLSAPSDDESAH